MGTERPTSGASAGALATQLREVRRRTRRLVEDLAPAQLLGSPAENGSPILWDLGHIGWFHEYWTLRQAHGDAALREDSDRLWGPATPPAARWELPLPGLDGTLEYMDSVLKRQVDHLERSNLGDDIRYFYDLAVRYEDMCVEALSATRQMRGYGGPDLGDRAPEGAGPFAGDVAVPGGRWRLGAGTREGFIFDNEKWAHSIDLEPFRIAQTPVTNLEFAVFVAEGGYRFRDFWSPAGWAWREAAKAERPVYWIEEDGQYAWRRYDEVEALAADAPVMFVSYHEAEAWCRWAKRRLPTEAEWEAAALGEPSPDGRTLADVKRRWPWGDEVPARFRANLDFAYDGALDVAACPAGDSAFGCRQMAGNIWEWTASDFQPFNGFSADPFEDYSKPGFGSTKVLRGGSFASSPRVARPGYRRFLTPDRRDGFTGFRTCAL
jgi:gamma-glutamyl hercynylcysteine S-oxide synthase